MQLFTPDNSPLLDIASIEPHPDGILIQGKIMGAMPMKAVLRPEELRRGLRFLGPRLLLTLLAMMFRRQRSN
jgi:hypothetical protein